MKLKLLVLLLLPTVAFAHLGHRPEPVLLPADAARTESDLNHRVRVVDETRLLLSLAKETISDGVIDGKYDVAFRVTGYSETAIHEVNQTLRKSGYKCKVFYARLIHEYLDEVSWSK